MNRHPDESRDPVGNEEIPRFRGMTAKKRKTKEKGKRDETDTDWDGCDDNGNAVLCRRYTGNG